MLNGLLAEALVHERTAQRERDLAHARVLREAKLSHGRRASRAGGLHRAAALGMARVGGWLVHAGYWLQALGAGRSRPSPDAVAVTG